MKKLVMFDVDGTLTDTTQLDSECFVAAVTEVTGFSDISGDWTDYTHVSDAGVIHEVYERRAKRRPTGQEIQAVQDVFFAILKDRMMADPDCCREVPGAGKLIAALRSEKDVIVAIATGGWGTSAVMKLTHAGIDISGLPFANANHFIARVNIMRQAQRLALATIGESCLETVEKIYVGDGLWDVRASRTLGSRLIGIGDGNLGSMLEAEGVDPILNSYEPLEAVLKLIGV